MPDQATIPELNERERKAIPLICNSFCLNYNSSAKKIKSDAIVEKLQDRGYKFSDATFRKVLGHIRRNDLMYPGFILGDRGGYWYSEDQEEQKAVWLSEYGRAIQILTNFKPLHRKFKEDKNQLSLYGIDLERIGI